jgi:Family of unknown function (DUF6220)
MRKVYVTLTGLLVVSVVIQFYFAAFGVFTAPENDSQFILHLVNGRFVLPLLCLLCIAAAALARAPGRLIGFTAIPFGLLVLQTVLFVVAGLAGASPEKTNLAGQIILGLHAVNGLCILGVSLLLFRRAKAFADAANRPTGSGAAGTTDGPADERNSQDRAAAS